MFETLLQATTGALDLVWTQIIKSFFLNILIALILFFIGWFLAIFFQRLVVKILKASRIDQALEKVISQDVLGKMGMKMDVANWIGFLVKWFFIFVALLAASDALGLVAVTDFFKDVVRYVPEVIIAALILIVGIWFAGFLEKLVRASISAGRMKMAAFVGAVVKWSVIIFALFSALEHVRIASSIIQMLMTGFIAMLAIAGGIAFGLGGKDYASKAIGKMKDEISE